MGLSTRYLLEKQRQKAYVQWLLIIAEAREAIRDGASLETLIAIENRAREAISPCTPDWVERFQNREDYSDRVKEHVGGPLSVELLRYLKRTRPWG